MEKTSCEPSPPQRSAAEQDETERNDFGDGGIIVVKGDKLRTMMKGHGGDEQVEGAGGGALVAALLTQPGGVTPQVWRGGQQGKRGELGFDFGTFLRGGVAEDLKGDGFTNGSLGIQNPRVNAGFETGRRFAAGEVHPKGCVNQSRHCSARLVVWA